MGEPLILEILDRRGKVTHRQKFTDFPIRIGRDYSNELILDDDAVSPRHLQIEAADNGWHVVDLGSENGSFAGNAGARFQESTIAADQRLRVGRTILQFRSIASAVAPTVLHGGFLWRLMELLGNLWIMLALLAINIGLLTWSSFLDQANLVKTSDLIVTAASVGFAALLWASAWALLARILNHRAVLFEYISLASIMTILGVITEAIDIRLDYLWPDTLSVGAVTSLLWLVLVFGLGYLHLKLATALSRSKLCTMLGVGVAVLCLILLTTNYRDAHTFTTDVEYNANLQLLPTRLLPSQPTDHFFDDLGDVKDQAQKKAKDLN